MAAKALRIPSKVVLQWLKERSVPSFGSGPDATIPFDALVKHLWEYEMLTFPWLDEGSPWTRLRFGPVYIVKPLCVQRALGGALKGALTSRFVESCVLELRDFDGYCNACLKRSPSGVILQPGHSLGDGMAGKQVIDRFKCHFPILVLGNYGDLPEHAKACKVPSSPEAIVEAFAAFAQESRELLLKNRL